MWKIANGKAILVGGNISNTAKITKYIDVDQNQKALQNLSPYSIILKKKGRPASLLMIPIILGIGAIEFFQMSKK